MTMDYFTVRNDDAQEQVQNRELYVYDTMQELPESNVEEFISVIKNVQVM